MFYGYRIKTKELTTRWTWRSESGLTKIKKVAQKDPRGWHANAVIELGTYEECGRITIALTIKGVPLKKYAKGNMAAKKQATAKCNTKDK